MDVVGGVTAMDDFLIKFFPAVYRRKLHAKEDNYCKYDNQYLQLFTSSLYLAALVSSFAASKMCSKLGRKPTIFVASAFFLFGGLVSAAAQRVWTLILGRVLLGVGVGFGNEVLINVALVTTVLIILLLFSHQIINFSRTAALNCHNFRTISRNYALLLLLDSYRRNQA